jgi:hypothetical protein
VLREYQFSDEEIDRMVESGAIYTAD